MNKKFTFNPTISFDGVAIIVGVIMLAVWMGRLAQKVDQHDAIIVNQQSQLQKQNETISTLAAIVSERNRRPPPYERFQQKEQ